MQDKYILALLRDTAGFGAAKIMRRIIGLAQVPDMWEIPDERQRGIAQSLALNVARSWLMNRRGVTSIQDLVDMVSEAKPSACVN